jgi:hypothetical protein
MTTSCRQPSAVNLRLASSIRNAIDAHCAATLRCRSPSSRTSPAPIASASWELASSGCRQPAGVSSVGRASFDRRRGVLDSRRVARCAALLRRSRSLRSPPARFVSTSCPSSGCRHPAGVSSVGRASFDRRRGVLDTRRDARCIATLLLRSPSPRSPPARVVPWRRLSLLPTGPDFATKTWRRQSPGGDADPGGDPDLAARARAAAARRQRGASAAPAASRRAVTTWRTGKAEIAEKSAANR